ncbi:LytR/AlgR family response regulator transcription factor [Enterococcus faecalis]
MGIYILEDQQFQAEMLKTIIEKITKENGFDLEDIHIFKKKQDLLKHIRKTADINIYFLDIQIKNKIKMGFEAAQDIRKIDKNGLIVFVSTHSELAMVSYKYMVSALTFIEKDASISEFYSMVSNCIKKYNNEKKIEIFKDVFLFESKSVTLKLPFKDICYFRTTYDHRIELVAKTQVREFYGKLKQLEKNNKRLIRVHQSFLVNFDNVVGLDKKNRELIFFNSDRVPVSRKYYKKVVETFTL